MKNIIIALVAVFSLSVFAAPSADAKLLFGERQDIRKLVDVDLKGEQNESLYLGHKVTTYFFLLGVYVKDDGYVLGVNSDPKRYYVLPEASVVTKLQEEGSLPKELPKYKLTPFDYIAGYSLFLALAGIGVWALLGKAFRKSRMKNQQA